MACARISASVFKVDSLALATYVILNSYLPNRFEWQFSFKHKAFWQPFFSCLNSLRAIYLSRLRFSSTSFAVSSDFSSFWMTGYSAFSSSTISASFLRISIGASLAALRWMVADEEATGWEVDSCYSADFSWLASELCSSFCISESSSELGSWLGCGCEPSYFFSSWSDSYFFG